MATDFLLRRSESLDGPNRDVPTSTSSGGGVPEPGSSMAPHSAAPEQAPPSCMFCEQTFSRQEELGPHVLAQHPTSFLGPAVLRVDAQFRIPGERARAGTGSPAVSGEDDRRCGVCGLASQDPSQLEAHLRGHKDCFTFRCSVCGRRFREPWFLKTHMRMHAKAGSKGRTQDPEAPVTVNGVVQAPPPEPALTRYRMCLVCGFFFHDHDALARHSRGHRRDPSPGGGGGGGGGGGAVLTQESFLLRLGLRPHPPNQSERSSGGIPQLDPFTTYQAWQLATRGKIAVGPHPSKDSTDNEDGVSDKDESGGGGVPDGDRGPREVPEPEPPSQDSPGTRRRSLMQRVKEQERPTRCEDCCRTFRTYHQLVLHSRVHQRGQRGVEDGPPSADVRLEQAEEGCEEAPLENPGAGTCCPLRAPPAAGSGYYSQSCRPTCEDAPGQARGRSKACSYCGKSFRSSYYLTIHLRTHTGEKPYKCVYCDYAAAQKTSLKYHLDRRHRDRRRAETPSRPPASPGEGQPREEAGSPAGAGAGTLAAAAAASEDGWRSLDDRRGRPPQELVPAVADEDERPVNPEKAEPEEEEPDAPLNLSLKAPPSAPPSAPVPSACRSCAYRTFYPEVLAMHRRLQHRDAPAQRSGPRPGWAHLTGCPPALNGKDVAPLPAFARAHPRRTKSPPRPREKPPSNPSLAPRRSPVRLPPPDVQEAQRQLRGDAPSRLQPPRLAEPSRKSFSRGRSIQERPGPPDHAPLRGGGVAWRSDAARLCFGPLPPMDFGEPSSKRFKYVADAGVFGGPVGAASSRLLMGGGRGGKSAAQLPPDSLGPSKSSGAVGGSLEGDWTMMNLLGSCSANQLASLYRGAPPPPAHAGLANPRAGGITVLYQHLPTLPALPRRDPAALFPQQRYGTADKTA